MIFPIDISSAKTFIISSLFGSIIVSGYTNFYVAGIGFLIFTTLDTITAINAGAKDKGLKFNPFKKYFWTEIKSELIRIWLKKVFKEYLVYVIMAFTIEIFMLRQQMRIEVIHYQLNLPVFCLWLFSAVEAWSIGENIEASGGTNYVKKMLHFFKDFIPEKFKAFFHKKE